MLYTILDLETTGFSKEMDHLLEFGYMQIDKQLNIIRTGSLYFYREDWNVNTPAQSVHGLTRDYLEKHIDEFDDNLIRMYALVQNSVVIGKNSDKFDIPFINVHFRKYANPVGPITLMGTLDLEEFYTPKFRSYYREKYGQDTKKRGTLSELMELIGYSDSEIRKRFSSEIVSDRDRAHSALYDVFMTYLLVDYATKNYGMEI